MKQLPISVIMLTLNEEYHLEKAIENVKPWASEIFILDSCSTDRTVDIALEHGVNIAQRRFTNYGDQWNFAIENFPVSAPWTMKLDPDERITAALVEEMARVTQLSNTASGYAIPIRLWFMGKPLHSILTLERLWKTGKCKFSDVIVNEHLLIDGEGRLSGELHRTSRQPGSKPLDGKTKPLHHNGSHQEGRSARSCEKVQIAEQSGENPLIP